MERRLAAILAADVVGYSRLIRADEEGTLAALKAVRQSLIDPKIAAHRGRIVKLMGDGMLAEFGSVVDAVRAATEIQHAVADRNAGLPEERRIEFRVGINLGDVVIDGDDIHGDGVNIAARLEGIAQPGGICISGMVYEGVRDRIDIPFEDMGEQEVKNIVRPVHVWRWPTSAAAIRPVGTGSEDSKASGKPSVAVLPFDNMSADPDQEFLADGIVEDVITELSRFRWLLVIARNSTFTYRGSGKHVREIGRELGVRYVVEGSVRRAANRLRVSAQLIEAESGAHIWADRYDREVADIFDLQDEVTKAIVLAIEPELGAHERGLARRKPTASLTAWELYQRGITEYIQMDDSSHTNAERLFSAAIEKDPDFALAYAGLARMHGMQLIFGRVANRKDTLDAGMKLANKAINLDSRCDDAYRSLGLLLTLSRRIEEAIGILNQGILLNPNSAPLHFNLAQAHLMGSNFDAAIAGAVTALRLSPNDPLAWLYRVVCGIALMFRDGAGDSERAATELRRASSLGNAGWPTFFTLAVINVRLKQFQEAELQLRKATNLKPDLSLAFALDSLPIPKLPPAVEDATEMLVSLGLPRK